MNKLSEMTFDLNGEQVTIYLEQGEGLIRVDYPEFISDQFTLDDVYQKYKESEGLIYVFADGGREGAIYRCGNYGKGIWQEYAITKGYA